MLSELKDIKKIRKKIFEFEYKVLSIDIGGSGMKIGIFKINPILRIPILSSTLKKKNIELDNPEENIYNFIKEYIEDKKKNLKFACISLSDEIKIFKNWRSINKNKRNNYRGLLKKILTNKFNLQVYEINDIEAHSIGCRTINGILNKRYITFTLVLGTSPSIFISDKDGKIIKNSNKLIKKKKYLWEYNSINKSLGAKSYQEKKNIILNKNNEILDELIIENKYYFIKVWNTILKPIFISGGNDKLNFWNFDEPPRFIFLTGGLAHSKLSGYISLMNSFLKKSSKLYKNTEIVLGPINSGLIGTSCLPFL